MKSGTFVGKKEARLTLEEKRGRDLGNQYAFVAIDVETKLVPTFTVGKRDGDTAVRFITDLKTKLNGNGCIQLTTDGLNAYIGAVELAFGSNVDFAQQVKLYEVINPGPGRYSPPRVAEVVSTTIQGNPNEAHISTSYVERHNLTELPPIVWTGFLRKYANGSLSGLLLSFGILLPRSSPSGAGRAPRFVVWARERLTTSLQDR